MKCLGGKVGPHCVLFNLAAWSIHFFFFFFLQFGCSYSSHTFLQRKCPLHFQHAFSPALRTILFGQLSLFLCAPTRGCWPRAAFLRTRRESKTKMKSTVSTSTVFPGVHFSALCAGKEPMIVPWRFLPTSGRTTPEQHSMVNFSCLCNPQPLQPQLETLPPPPCHGSVIKY